MKLKFLLAIALLAIAGNVNADSYAVEIDAVLDRCCEFGSKHSTSYHSCTNFFFNISSEIPKNLVKLCRSNIEFCCEKDRRKKHCFEGVNWAKTESTCTGHNHKNSEMFKLCCSACKVGQQIASSGGKCNQPTWGSIDDEARNECCENFEDYSFDETMEAKPEELIAAKTSSESCGDDNGCHHSCSKRNGEVLCGCNEGYKLARNLRSCIEDVTTTAPAPESIRKYECGVGYDKNDIGDCDDIDECETQEACSKMEKCVNTRGSFYCILPIECPSGFDYDEDTEQCEEIYECEHDPCSATETCEKADGSYKCVPKTCDSGYELNTSTGDCDDIDECQTHRCTHNLRCVNNPGSYDCECDHGLRKDSGNPRWCSDIDECAEHPGICDQKCYNFYGSYRCSCNWGYKLKSDNRTCEDIDECAVNGKKYCAGTCKNTQGNFKCECPKGFTMVGGRHCVDIDECSDNKKLCSGRNDHCLNTYGSYQCMERRCDRGYRFDNGACYLLDRSLCYENSNEVFGKCSVPLVYGFTYMAVPSNSTAIYTLTIGAIKHFDFELKKFRIRAGKDVIKADESFFQATKSNGSLIVEVMKPLFGPQEVFFDYWLYYHENHRIEERIHSQRISIVVSEYSSM